MEAMTSDRTTARGLGHRVHGDRVRGSYPAHSGGAALTSSPDWPEDVDHGSCWCGVSENHYHCANCGEIGSHYVKDEGFSCAKEVGGSIW